VQEQGPQFFRISAFVILSPSDSMTIENFDSIFNKPAPDSSFFGLFCCKA
jgi:hypothetical protein